jgi:uncharacterized membrane protein
MQIAIQWLHVFFGIFWFGGTLFANFVVVPAITRISPGAQKEMGNALSQTGQIIRPISYATIVLGILRGTVWGPVKDVDVLLGTAYGLTWLVALVIAVGLVAYGQFVIEPFRERIGRATQEEAKVLVGQAGRIFGLELIGFFLIFTAMILMRFGL